MKKFQLKNCIAFTLTEMALVLLITSVIAASATPIITSRVSDAANKGGVDSSESPDSPWRSAINYNGGGIYNIPATKTAFLSISHKPVTNPQNYDYPSFIVYSITGENFIKNPQIAIFPERNIYRRTIISMDAFENVALLHAPVDSFYQIQANDTIGEKNVYIGSKLQDSHVTNDKIISDRSIIIGYGINTYATTDAINIGYGITRYAQERDTINIGTNISGTYSSTLYDNIHIGNYASYGNYGRSNIYMGNYAGYDNRALRSVAIGNYAGYGYKHGGNYYNHADNVMIGLYSGYYIGGSDTASSKNVMIGYYAGSSHNNSATNLYHTNSLMIGNYAGFNLSNSGTDLYSVSDIAIGDYANAHISNGAKTLSTRSIYIGNYAGYNSSRDTKFADNIYMGTDAGKNSQLYGSVLLGSHAGRYASGYDNVMISGGNPGSYSKLHDSILIGTLAGDSFGKNESNIQDSIVAIGYNTCSNLKGGGKMCIGSGTLNNNNSNINVTNDSHIWSIWSTTAAHPQMVIGYVDKGLKNQKITLYASKVYRIGKNTFDIADGTETNNYKLSDIRFKKNLVLSSRSLKDIRKVNIYDYNFKDDIHKAPRIGVIAQEYRKIFPNEVSREPHTKKLAVSSEWLIYTMINAIKDVDKEVQSLQNDMKQYVAGYMGLKTKLTRLEQQAKQIEQENAQMKAHLARINAKLQ